MKKLLLGLILCLMMAIPVQAMEANPPQAPQEAQKYMPEDTQSFGDGLWYILKTALQDLHPSIAQGAASCLSVISIVILVSFAENLDVRARNLAALTGCVMIGISFIKPVQSLIGLGTETIFSLTQYGKLLLPVMTAALAAQGGISASAGLYLGTSLLCAVLNTVINRLLVPLMYIYLCLSIANSALGDDTLAKIRSFCKWIMTWSLKIILYVFTGYLSITGVVSGTADASALKAARLAISGAVPVVGGILSDASETILVGAGIMKNAAGIYGMLAMIAIWIGPFLQIAIQYLLTRLTSAVSAVFASGSCSALIEDLSELMGMILAATGTACLLLLVSTVCFMKGLSL